MRAPAEVAHRVVAGPQHVAHDDTHEVELAGHPQQDREPVELRVTAVGGGQEVAEVPPDRGEVEDLGRLPDHLVAQPGPRQHRQRQQPQHVLRRVDLVDEQEAGDHEEAELRQTRRGRRDQADHQDAHAPGPEEQPRPEVDGGGGRGPVEPLVEDQPDGPQVGGAVGVEPPEGLPVLRARDVRRRVDEQPRHGGRAEGLAELAEPALAQADDEDAAEQEQRVELGRHAQPDHHPGQHRALARPRPQRSGHAGDRQHVPVHQAGQQQSRGDREQGGVPGPAPMDAGEQPRGEQRERPEADRVHRDEAQHLRAHCGVAGHRVGRRAGPRLQVRRAAQPVGDLRGPPRPVGDDDGVLHGGVPAPHRVVVDVRPVQLDETASGVEVGQVGVAHVRVVDVGVAPLRVEAGGVLDHAEREAERGQGQQDAHRGPPAVPAGARAHRTADDLAQRPDARVLDRRVHPAPGWLVGRHDGYLITSMVVRPARVRRTRGSPSCSGAWVRRWASPTGAAPTASATG